MTFSTLFGTLGSFGIGFVLGWTLYFANRGKSGNLSVAELAAIAGVIAGSTIITFLDGIGVPNTDRAFLFGGYGLGVLIGFLTYFFLYRSSLGQAQSPTGIALMSVQETTAPAARNFSRAPSVMRSRSAGRVSTPQGDLNAAIVAAAETADQLYVARENALDPDHEDYDPAEASKISVLLTQTDYLLRDLRIAAGVQYLSSAGVSDLLDTLETETTALKEEAGRMKEATGKMTKVSEMFTSLDTIIGKLRELV